MRYTRLLLCYARPPPASALYVSGRTAEKVASVLRPCLDNVLSPSRLPTLRDSIRRRRSAMRASELDTLVSDWHLLRASEAERTALMLQRSEVADRGAVLKKQPDSPARSEEMRRMRETGTKVKQQLRDLQPQLWNLQEQVLPRIASLPNALHQDTPDQDVLEEIRAPSEFSWMRPPVEALDNVFAEDVEQSAVSPGAHYLHGSAAAFELALMEFACNRLTSAGFERVSCPDTVKSLVVDGCGLDFADGERVVRLASWHEGSKHSPLGLHLVGGASLPAICALLAKSRQSVEVLPLRLVTAGRIYGPPRTPTVGSLAPQCSAVRHLTACGSEADADEAFHSSVSLLQGIVADLGLGYRLRHVCASGLQRSESQRTELQLPIVGSHFTTVAYVSCHGDYISRRLHMAYGDRSQVESELLHVVEGCAVIVLPALQALMGGSARLSRWPHCLQPFSYTGMVM